MSEDNQAKNNQLSSKDERLATAEEIEAVKIEYSKLERKLLAILSHPSCPKEFKEVFESKGNI